MNGIRKVYPTVLHMLSAGASYAPEKQALVCEADSLTFGQYFACVTGFAHELIERGAKGERVGIVLGNSVDFCVAVLGALGAGSQVVTLNPTYTVRELRTIFEDAGLHAIVYADDLHPRVGPLVEEFGIRHHIRVGNETHRLTSLRGGKHLMLPLPAPAPDDLALLQYTGGTTGSPKGVNISHGSLAISISQREALLPTREEDERLLCVMPLFHTYALSMCLFNMLYCRGTLVILPRYTPDAVLNTIARQQITIFAGSPTLFSGLLGYAEVGSADFSSLRVSYSGSSALPEELLRRWETVTGAPVVEGYGQTEGGTLTFNPLNGPRKCGSVGVPLPGVEIEIVDLETGTKVLEAGEHGEIRVRGPQLMTCYRNLPRETAAALREGWLYTGDIGELDADGYLFIRDRKKEMAKVSGFNVFPREVEEVLYLHEAVKEAAVIGLPDVYRGEVIKAFVVLREGWSLQPDELLEHCRANLTKYKIPAAIEISSMLPKTAVGKIDKKRLRQLS